MLNIASAASAAPTHFTLHPGLLASLLRANRVALLYGEPGRARDAMVRRGLMPLLGPHQAQRASRADEVAIRFDRWGTLPLEGLRAQIDAEFPIAWPAGPAATLADHIEALGEQSRVALRLVLDGFERHLAEPAQRPDIAQFDRELAECLTRTALPIHVLIVVSDDAEHALQRYAGTIPNFTRDWLRLPAGTDSDDDASPWVDTEIQALFDDESSDDETAKSDGDTEWPLDLRLDEPAAPPPAAARSGAKTGSKKRSRAAAVVRTKANTRAAQTAPSESAAPAALGARATQPEPPRAAPAAKAAELAAPAWQDKTVRPVAAPAAAPPAAPDAAPVSIPLPRTLPMSAAATEPIAEPARETWHETSPFVSGVAFAAPQLDGPPTAPPSEWPDLLSLEAAVTEQRTVPSAARPTSEAPLHAAPTLAAPGWATEPDAFTVRRMRRLKPGWQRWAGIATYLAMLAVGAWWAGDWIVNRDEVVPGAPTVEGSTTTQPVTVPMPSAATAKAAKPNPSTAAPPTATGSATSVPPAAAPVRRELSVALPPDAGAAAAMFDELTRRVAAPAGITLKLAGTSDASSLAIWRSDMLQAAHGPTATPVRVLSPLFNEQIQVVVRTDARWDYLHQLRGLRLGIGRADGARARTARTLYRQLFGEALPASSANELDEAQALQELIDGKSLDAVVLVSEQPVLPQLPAAQRRLLRELGVDPFDRRTAGLLQAYPIPRLVSADKPRPTVTSYLVAADPVAPASAGTLRALASALCRAQPALQEQGSALLRGVNPSQQPPVGWPYLLPRTRGGGCPPAEPSLAETQRGRKG